MNLQSKKLARHAFIDLDLSPDSTVFISGMARSGTTWLAEIINYDNSHRDILEPFLPTKVKAAQVFKTNQYLYPDNQNRVHINHAKKILSGNFRSRWSDWGNRRFICTRRIIKDVRSNLMLKWLLGIRPKMPTLFLIRHPLSIYVSWKKLGWGRGAVPGSGDFEQVISQSELLTDYPTIADGLTRINSADYFEKLIFLWGILHYVPFRQLAREDCLFIYYENLVLKPEEELGKIFSYLKKPFDFSALEHKIQTPSKTNYHEKKFSISPESLIQSWKKETTTVETLRTRQILEIFGLNHLYDDGGFPSYPEQDLPKLFLRDD
jgi:hypothetical protein